MPERIIFPEFRDEQEFSRYPFADSATLLSNTGQRIPPETFIDATVYPIGSRERVSISTITIRSRLVTIALSDPSGAVLCSGSFDPLDPPNLIALADRYGRAAGLLLSEPLRLAIFATWGVGSHTFGTGAAEFAASVSIPTPEIGVRGLLTEAGDLLTGDIWFVGDNGVVIREDGDRIIRIDIVGDPLFVRRVCAPEDLFTAPRFIKTINNCPPDEYGNFVLTVGDHFAADTIIRIYPVDNGLRIEAVGKVNKDG
jgi:hypothetical protein